MAILGLHVGGLGGLLIKRIKAYACLTEKQFIMLIISCVKLYLRIFQSFRRNLDCRRHMTKWKLWDGGSSAVDTRVCFFQIHEQGFSHITNLTSQSQLQDFEVVFCGDSVTSMVLRAVREIQLAETSPSWWYAPKSASDWVLGLRQSTASSIVLRRFLMVSIRQWLSPHKRPEESERGDMQTKSWLSFRSLAINISHNSKLPIEFRESMRAESERGEDLLSCLQASILREAAPSSNKP